MRTILASALLLANVATASAEQYAQAPYQPIELSQNDAKPINQYPQSAKVDMVPPSTQFSQNTVPYGSTTDSDTVKKSLIWLNF